MYFTDENYSSIVALEAYTLRNGIYICKSFCTTILVTIMALQLNFSIKFTFHPRTLFDRGTPVVCRLCVCLFSQTRPALLSNVTSLLPGTVPQRTGEITPPNCKHVWRILQHYDTHCSLWIHYRETSDIVHAANDNVQYVYWIRTHTNFKTTLT